MKKPLLKLLSGTFLLGGSMAVAQPTLTASGSNPVIGNSFTFNVTNYFSPGSAGANQTWNFSAISATSSSSSTVVAPSSTPNGSSFPAANIAFDNGSLGNYSYQKTTSAVFQNYGLVNSGGVVMSYSNPEDLMHYPFTYNNTYTDPWAVTFVNGGYTFYRTGTSTITADGYGTLITPAGTYTNVTRIHMLQVYKDSADFGGFTSVTNYTNDEYLWLKDGTRTSLAACFSAVAGGMTTQSGFFAGSVVGVDEIDGYLNAFNLFPNPAATIVNVGFNLVQSTGYKVSVYNSLGQVVLSAGRVENAIGEKNIALDVTSLPEGVYFAQVMLDGNAALTKRFTVTK